MVRLPQPHCLHWPALQVLADVRRVGQLLGQPAAGEAAAAALQRRVDASLAAVPPAAAGAGANGSCSSNGSADSGSEAGPSVAFLEWVAPIFVGGHWTPQLIEMAGGRHPLNPCK